MITVEAIPDLYQISHPMAVLSLSKTPPANKTKLLFEACKDHSESCRLIEFGAVSAEG